MISKSQQLKLPQPYPASQLTKIHIDFNSKTIFNDLLQGTKDIRQIIQFKRDSKKLIKELRQKKIQKKIQKEQQKILQQQQKKQSTINTITYKLSFSQIQIPYLITNIKQFQSVKNKLYSQNLKKIKDKQDEDKTKFQQISKDKQQDRQRKNQKIAKLMVAQSLVYQKKSIIASGQAYITLSVNSIYPAYILKYQPKNHQACFIQFKFSQKLIDFQEDSQVIPKYLGLTPQTDYNYLLVYPINYQQKYNNRYHFNHMIAILISEQLRFNTLMKIGGLPGKLTQQQKKKLQQMKKQIIFDKLSQYIDYYKNWNKLKSSELRQQNISILLQKLNQ